MTTKETILAEFDKLYFKVVHGGVKASFGDGAISSWAKKEFGDIGEREIKPLKDFVSNSLDRIASDTREECIKAVEEDMRKHFYAQIIHVDCKPCDPKPICANDECDGEGMDKVQGGHVHGDPKPKYEKDFISEIRENAYNKGYEEGLKHGENQW